MRKAKIVNLEKMVVKKVLDKMGITLIPEMLNKINPNRSYIEIKEIK